MAGAGIAEHAEGEIVVLRKHALGTQRRRHRDRPAFGDRFEERCSIVGLTRAPARTAIFGPLRRVAMAAIAAGVLNGATVLK
jgi:hypothetical protein